MTTETEPIRERLRPRVVETAEIGRLDLRLPTISEPSLPLRTARGFPSPFAVAMTGLGILVVGVIGIDLVQFVDGAFAHGTGVGILAAAAVAAGAGGALYWLTAELLGLFRLRSAERLRRLIPAALASELKVEIDAAAAIVARDPLLGEAVNSYRVVLEPHHTGRDALELFSRFVLAPADQLARSARPCCSTRCSLPHERRASFARSPRSTASAPASPAPSICCADWQAVPGWSAPSMSSAE